MCHGGGDSRGLVRHPADLVPWGLPPGGGLCGRPPAIGCGWRSALDVRGACSVEGLLTTGICPLACAGLATILTMRFVGRTGSSATGVRDFAIVGMARMAAVSVTAAPTMGLLIVDSMTVPVDQRCSEGMLGAFSLIAGACLVKGGGKTKVFRLSESQIARRVNDIAKAAGLADWEFFSGRVGMVGRYTRGETAGSALRYL